MIDFFLKNRLYTVLLLVVLLGLGLSTVPFNWQTGLIPRSPVPVDAIPNLGDPQQIVYTEWAGHSPQDVEDQVTYPLTTQLLGLEGVKTVRSHSGFGFSSVTLLFDESMDSQDQRAQILEKLASLPRNLLPDGAEPSLGPDATALGQIFWYTLQGRDDAGAPAAGWDLHELRTLQETLVKPALSAIPGVAEVASVGGQVREYQIEVDPLLLRGYGITLTQVAEAVRQSNRDVGARTLELNRVEYLIRGIGAVRSVEDLRSVVLKEGTEARRNIPVVLEDVAVLQQGPATRRGALSINGTEATGGVVTLRAGENPASVIAAIKDEITRIAPGLPKRTLHDGQTSYVTIVPFYDRSELIRETLGTLEEALSLQVLITLLVVMVMVMHLRSSLLIAILLPLAVWISFIWMRATSVDANVVALAGIAISIGTVVDMGIVLTENILQHLRNRNEPEPGLESSSHSQDFLDSQASPDSQLSQGSLDSQPSQASPDSQPSLHTIIRRATREVAPAIGTALLTTIVSFLPVFMLQGEEGRLFTPLAFTKTYVLLSALLIVLLLLPTLATFFFRVDTRNYPRRTILLTAAGILVWLLATTWQPAGIDASTLRNLLFIGLILALVLGTFHLYLRYYRNMLHLVLQYRRSFLLSIMLLLLAGGLSWLGFPRIVLPVTTLAERAGLSVTEHAWYQNTSARFPGLGREFMPSLDEGAFLLMPTTLPHAGLEETLDLMQQMDRRIAEIPEVKLVAGKIGRAETALDPAPISMFETLILYHPEFASDEKGRPIPDENGNLRRLWREHIRTPDDIWLEIRKAADLPGITSAPKLYPIETRLIMLQTGMRATMGLRVEAPDLETLDAFSLALESLLRQTDGVRAASVYADRALSKPYLEIEPNRALLAQYGLPMADVQQTIQTALGGELTGYSIEGRERVPIRVRLARSWRNHPETIAQTDIPTPSGAFIPLGELADIRYTTGPAAIRSENTFLTSYVTFEPEENQSASDLGRHLQNTLADAIQSGQLQVPEGARYQLEGEFLQQERAEKRLKLILPATLLIIILLLYRQFRSAALTTIIFSSILVVWAGGFFMLWLFGQPWFFDVHLFGSHLRDLFHIGEIQLSVAVWIGFLALFGIAVDDGVIMTTYLEQRWKSQSPRSRAELIPMATEAAMRRVRPCLMTTATTILALLPILTSAGKGSELMIPMAVPALGGMIALLISPLFIPFLYITLKERSLP